MTTSLNARLDEQITPILATIGALLTSTVGDTTYVSLKGYAGCQVVIGIYDGTTVTGSNITLKQATSVAGAGEKALAFTRMLANADYAAGKVLTETAVTNNTFTTQAVNSKISLHILDVKASDLDVAGGFDCFRVDGTAHASTNPVGSFVLYNLYGARYNGVAALTD